MPPPPPPPPPPQVANDDWAKKRARRATAIGRKIRVFIVRGLYPHRAGLETKALALGKQKGRGGCSASCKFCLSFSCLAGFGLTRSRNPSKRMLGSLRLACKPPLNLP